MIARVSLVVTVLNESESIESFLLSVLGQSRPPDEVVLVDGGSRDETIAVVERFRTKDPRIHLYCAPGSTIAEGRNIAIERATSPVIAVTDAGTVLAEDWLEKLIRPLQADNDVAVSAGFFLPGGESFFERCLSTIITPQLPEIDPATFLPSSRSVAFRKHWWRRVGGYPEWLRHCEDIVFGLNLKRVGARFVFVSDALVSWRSRPTILAFFRQYFNYSRGDGHAQLWPRRYFVRYSAYFTGVVLLASSQFWPISWVMLIAGTGLYFGKFYRRLWRLRSFSKVSEMFAVCALVPVIVLIGDVAKMIGYPLGRYERWRAGAPERLAPPRRPVTDVVAG